MFQTDESSSNPGLSVQEAVRHESYGAINSNDSDTEPLVQVKDTHKERENINIKAAFIHVVGDLIQSIGVLIAAFIIYFKVI